MKLSERLRGEADCAAGSAHPAVVQGLLEKATMAQNLESAVENLRGALEWYGDKKNHEVDFDCEDPNIPCRCLGSKACEDNGQRARDVMEEIENEIE